MQYGYIEKAYGISFFPGDKVEHTETNKCGKVMRVKPGHEHYVRVHFGPDGAGLCHPGALKIIERKKTLANSTD